MTATGFIAHHKTSLLAFTAGVGIALCFAFIPGLHRIIDRIDELGYLGIFIGGLLYGSALTASTATLIFVNAGPEFNPVLAGVIGGLAAALYDTVVFLVIRREAGHGWIAGAIARWRERHHVPDIFSFVVGGLIMASPFPDELASGLLGVTNGKIVPFLLTSFAANAIGIFILCEF